MPSQVDWIQRLRDLRRLMGWSQRKLAKELRVTPGAVSQWESGSREIPGPVRRLVEVYEQNLGIIEPPAAPGLKKINGSWSDRTLRTSATTAQIVSRLAGSSLRSLLVANARAAEIKAATQVAIAQQLVELLGDLKGLLMKLGQMVSYLDFAVPEHLRQVLQSLQDQTRPMDEDLVDGVFLQSLGKRPEQVFRRWEPHPFAAASIGQVHRATLPDGTDVAVKVQYPGIRQAIETDLANLGALDRLGQLLFPGQDRAGLLTELRERLLEECDYVREADNQEEFRALYAQTPGVLIPRVHRSVSTDRVLTMDYVEGQRFAAFVRDADQAAKDRAGETIFRVVSAGIFRHRLFNADPHPGNYLFPEGGAVAFVDFGCVKRYSRELVRLWARYTWALSEGRREEADRLAVQLGWVADPDGFDFDYHHKMMRKLCEPLISEEPFRFNRHFVENNWKLAIVENPNRTRARIPRELLFANRLQWGLHSVLAELGAQADWRGIFRENTATCVGE